MDTRTIRTEDDADAALAEAAAALRRGGVVAFPTETVYGIGVLEGDANALDRLRRLKGREAERPFQRLIGDATDLAKFGAILSETAEAFVARFWPGPLTLVLPVASGGTVGLRVPAATFVRDLARRAGAAIVASSANRAGEAPAQTADEAFRAFPGELDLVVDGGPAALGEASTVVYVEGETFRILRAGAIPAAEIEAAACTARVRHGRR